MEAGWKKASTTSQWTLNFHRSVITVALHDAFVEFHDDKAEIAFVKAPARKAVALQNFGAGELALTPLGAVSIIEAGKPAPSNGVEVKRTIPGFTPYVLTKVEVAAPATPGKPAVEAFLCPFWFVRATTVEAEVNMILSYKAVTVQSHKVQIPCLRNSSKVASGTELCVAKPADESDARAAASSAALAKSVAAEAAAKAKAAALSSSKAKAHTAGPPSKKPRTG